MIKREELAHYLWDYLACGQFQDYAPNGIQVEGRESIRYICTAVTASLDAVEQAVQLQADALLVHHGYFWKGEEAVITGMKRARIAQLMTHEINLYAYHLPLDCHLDLGNNACLGQRLGIQKIQQHHAGQVDSLLWSGCLSTPVSANHFSAFLAEKFQRKPLHLNGKSDLIHTVAWCSGGAQDFIVHAQQLGVDAYISGEVSERTYYQAQELGIHYFACGHHATERYGIQALGQHLSQRFDLTHHFIDSGNPV